MKRRPDLPAYLRPVLLLAAQGMRNDDIAVRLYLSPSTVKNYIYALSEFFGVRNRTQMVIAAMHGDYAPCPHHCRIGHPPRRKPRPERRKDKINP